MCAQAVTGAHVVATDTWVSMGQEEEAAKRIKDYEGYQVSKPDQTRDRTIM